MVNLGLSLVMRCEVSMHDRLVIGIGLVDMARRNH